MDRRNFMRFTAIAPLLSPFRNAADISEDIKAVEDSLSPICHGLNIDRCAALASRLAPPYHFKGFVSKVGFQGFNDPGDYYLGAILWRADVRFRNERRYVIHYVTLTIYDADGESGMSDSAIARMVNNAKERAKIIMKRTEERGFCLNEPFSKITWVQYERNITL